MIDEKHPGAAACVTATACSPCRKMMPSSDPPWNAPVLLSICAVIRRHIGPARSSPRPGRNVRIAVSSCAGPTWYLPAATIGVRHGSSMTSHNMSIWPRSTIQWRATPLLKPTCRLDPVQGARSSPGCERLPGRMTPGPPSDTQKRLERRMFRELNLPARLSSRVFRKKRTQMRIRVGVVRSGAW